MNLKKKKYNMMFLVIVLTCLTASALVLGASSKSQKIKIDGRIVGGESVDIKDCPHQVSLLYGTSHICGGSIITERHVVTAAHCTDGSGASSFQVRAGSSTKGSGGVVVQVAEIHQHPGFDFWDMDYDIAVLKLAEPLEFNENIQPISFNFQQPAAGNDAVTSGWGALIEGGSSPRQLQAVTVKIVSKDECEKAYGTDYITARMLCAGLPEGGKDACRGDSGGPLVVDGKLVGVVSWGAGCARPGYPGVYYKVSSLPSFVLDHSRPE